MPASLDICICSGRAFAVTAITGTGRVNVPSFCHSRILRTQVNPSMTCEMLVSSGQQWRERTSAYGHLLIHKDHR